MHRRVACLLGSFVLGICSPSVAAADPIATLGQKIPDARLLWQRAGKIYHSKIKNFSPQVVTVGAVEEKQPRWSPNGQQILFVGTDGVWIMKQDFTSKTKVIENAHTASWTRDGKSITAVAGNGYEIVKYELATKKLTTIFDSRDGNGQKISQAAELRSGGRFVLTFRLTPSHVTEIIDIKDPKNPKYISNAQMERGDCSPAWSPDGSFILNTARTSSRPVLKAVFNSAGPSIADSKHLVGLNTSTKFYIHGQRVSNDGKYVAFGGKIFSGSGDREIYIWRIGDPDKDAVRMTFHSADDELPSLFIPGSVTPPPPPPECTNNAACDDGDPCTKDTCNSEACNHTAIDSCCSKDSQCDDLDPCTADSCDTSSNTCTSRTISGCCTKDSQCNDGNGCSTDSCQDNVCKSQPIGGCCSEDADCGDTNPCTTDSCDTATGLCENSPQQDCCSVDVDCNDKDVCTLDSCDSASNSCVFVSSAGCDKQISSTPFVEPTAPNEETKLLGGCSFGVPHGQCYEILCIFLIWLLATRRRRPAHRICGWE